MTKKVENSNETQNPKLGISVVSGSLPSVDEAGVMAVKISEMVEPPLTAQEQSFFIAGFCECVKWLGSNRIYTIVDQDGDLINCWKNKENAEKHAEDLRKKHGTHFETTEEPLF